MQMQLRNVIKIKRVTLFSTHQQIRTNNWNWLKVIKIEQVVAFLWLLQIFIKKKAERETCNN